MKQIGLGGVRLFSFEHACDIRVTGAVSDDAYFLCSPRHGRIRLQSSDGSVVVSAGSPLMMPQGEFTAEAIAYSKMLIVRFERNAVLKALAELVRCRASRPLEFRFPSPLLNTKKVQLLERYLDFLFRESTEAAPTLLMSARASNQAERLLSTLLLETLPNSYSNQIEASGSRMPWVVKAADDAIQEHLTEITSTSDLAAMIRANPTTLRKAFKKYKGLPPSRYLRKLRFRHVRRELQRACPPDTVTDIAMRWGFHHLGRFSVEYRHEFSERPSDTLRSSQNAHLLERND